MIRRIGKTIDGDVNTAKDSQAFRGKTDSSKQAQFGQRRVALDDLARVRYLQVIGRSNAGTSRYDDVFIRLGLLPDVDPIVSIVLLTNLNTMQTGRLADLCQHLGFDCFGVVQRLWW